jgi:transcriptional regulator with XRE-family HTH domain
MRTNEPAPTPLRAAREKARLTQLQLAARAGCSIQTISIAERTGHLTEPSAAKIAAVLGVQPEDLRP